MIRWFRCLSCLIATLAACSPAAGDEPPRSHSIVAFSEPALTVHLAFAEPGKLVALHRREGEFVKQGELIAELDDSVLQATLAIAIARSENEAPIAAARAERDLKKQHRDDVQSLVQSGGASEQELRRAQANLDIAEANLIAAQQELRIQGLEVERLRKQIEQKQLKAPIDGYVVKLHRQVGEYVSTNESDVVDLVQLNPLRVRFHVPQDVVDQIEKDQQLSIRFFNSRETVVARVDLVSPVVLPESNTVMVQLLLTNDELQHRSGVRCELELPLRTASK